MPRLLLGEVGWDWGINVASPCRKPVNALLSFNTLLTKGLLKLQTQRDSCSVYYPDCQVEMIGRRSDTVTPCVRGEANSGHQMPKSGAGTANRKSCRVRVLWLGLRPPHLRMLNGWNDIKNLCHLDLIRGLNHYYRGTQATSVNAT